LLLNRVVHGREICGWDPLRWTSGTSQGPGATSQLHGELDNPLCLYRTRETSLPSSTGTFEGAQPHAKEETIAEADRQVKKDRRPQSIASNLP